MIFFLRLLITFGAAGTAWLSGSELLERQGNRNFTLSQPLMQQARTLQQNKQLSEAKLLAEFIVDNPEFGKRKDAEALVLEVDQELNSYWASAQRFAEGALTGEPFDTASLLGSLSLDLFVIGDVRDLAVQGWKSTSGGDGDEIVMALSAVGLLTTLAPQIDWIPGLLKALKRTGKLSASFIKQMQKIATRALRTGDMKPIKSALGDTAKAVEKLGPGPFAGVARHIDSTTDLRAVAAASQINAPGTYILLSNFGNSGLKTLQKNGGNIAALMKNIRRASRLLKAGDKSISTVPGMWLLSVLLACAVICIYSVLHALARLRRPRRKGLY